MIEKINDLLKKVEEFKPKTAAEIEEFRVRMLGRKGQLNDILDEFKKVAPELKRELGQKINTLKIGQSKRSIPSKRRSKPNKTVPKMAHGSI